MAHLVHVPMEDILPVREILESRPSGLTLDILIGPSIVLDHLRKLGCFPTIEMGCVGVHPKDGGYHGGEEGEDGDFACGMRRDGVSAERRVWQRKRVMYPVGSWERRRRERSVFRRAKRAEVGVSPVAKLVRVSKAGAAPASQ